MTAAGFLERYEIHSIRISREADIRDAEACLVEVSFAGGSRVSFKLLDGPAARTHRYFEGIQPGPEPIVVAGGAELGSEEREHRLQQFLGGDIEMIGGLVEQEEVGTCLGQLRQRQPSSLAPT